MNISDIASGLTCRLRILSLIASNAFSIQAICRWLGFDSISLRFSKDNFKSCLFSVLMYFSRSLLDFTCLRFICIQIMPRKNFDK